MEGNRSIRCFHGKIKANLGDKEKVYRTHFSYALWWECFPRVQVCACMCPCASKVRNGIPIKKQKGEKWNQCSITLGVYFYNLQKKFSTSTPHHVVFSLHTPHTDPPPIYDTLPPLLPNSCNLIHCHRHCHCHCQWYVFGFFKINKEKWKEMSSFLFPERRKMAMQLKEIQNV